MGDSIKSLIMFIFYLVISLITLPLSGVVTKRHKDIGNEQLEIIRHHYSSNVIEEIGKISGL